MKKTPYRKKFEEYLVGIQDFGEKTRRAEHTTSAPVVYITNKWGGKWKRIKSFEVQTIELRAASDGEDTAVIKYRYGHISYPNFPGDKYRVVNTKRFTGKTMWVRIFADKKCLFQGVLTNVDDEFYGKAKDIGGTPCGVQTFTFKGGLYLLGRFQFYKSFWHTEGEHAEEISLNDGVPQDIIVDWIPDFGGESPEYSVKDTPEMEIQKTALGNMTIYEKEVEDEKGKAVMKKFIAFGGAETFRPEGAFAYLSNLIDFKKWSGPKFDVDFRYVQADMAGKQIKSSPVMNARDFLLEAFDDESGYDFYFVPKKQGYTIVPFPRENNRSWFWVNVNHNAVVNCSVSRDVDDYYTAVRVVGERVIHNLSVKYRPTPVRNPVGVDIANEENQNEALNMFDLFEKREDYTGFRLPNITIGKDGQASLDHWSRPFLQTKYREVLNNEDFYYNMEGDKLKGDFPYVYLDARKYNRVHGGDGGDDDEILWRRVPDLEISAEGFKQAIGFKLKVKDWTRLLDGIRYGYDNGIVIKGDDSFMESYDTMHLKDTEFPVILREREVPDISMSLCVAHFAYESDQRFQYVFGKYEDEYRTLTVYEPDARLIIGYEMLEMGGGVKWKVHRNDWTKLKARYEAILKEYSEPPAAMTCQIKGILTPDIIGKRITISGEGQSQITRTSLDHISYSFPEGKTPQTRI